MAGNPERGRLVRREARAETLGRARCKTPALYNRRRASRARCKTVCTTNEPLKGEPRPEGVINFVGDVPRIFEMIFLKTRKQSQIISSQVKDLINLTFFLFNINILLINDLRISLFQANTGTVTDEIN